MEAGCGAVPTASFPSPRLVSRAWGAQKDGSWRQSEEPVCLAVNHQAMLCNYLGT